MKLIALIFLLLTGGLLLALPRRWAAFPLLIGTCYMTQAQGMEVGTFSFSLLRLLIAVGLARLAIRGEFSGLKLVTLDKLMILLSTWALLSSLWHKESISALVFRAGLVYDYLGLYLLFRCLFTDIKDLVRLYMMTAVVLMPIAIEMLWEHLASHNFFSYLGGVPAIPLVRGGHIRAQGPFRHAILAGTVGAVILPWMVGLKASHPRLALGGAASCVAMVLASRSSGPVGSLLAGVAALFFWRYRFQMRAFRWLAVAGYVLLDLIMEAPAYFLIARVDFVGGSTGYHRAALIKAAFAHLGEWWWAGTDYTRHWMPTGVSFSPAHTDITNHYIRMGVIGGLPLVFLFIAVLVSAFSQVGKSLQKLRHDSSSAFLVWCVGSSLFAHAVTCIGVSYFDQSFLFLILTLAATLVFVPPIPSPGYVADDKSQA